MLLQHAAGFVLVSLCWGATNPLIKRGSRGLERVEPHPLLGRTFAELAYLLTRWQYVVPLLLNLAGSVVYYHTLAEADLSLAVPIANSLTFIFTTLTGALLGEKVGGTEAWLGMAIVVAGVSLCVSSKVA